jgi:hypothetical protein
MRKSVGKFAVGVAFAIAALSLSSLLSSRALSATLTIREGPTETDPLTVESDLIGFGLFEDTPEFATGAGSLGPPISSSFLAVGDYAAGLFEPGTGETILSDFIVLHVSEPAGGLQSLTFDFFSDDTPLANVIGFATFVGGIEETGALQLLPFGEIGGGPTTLEVYVQSGVDAVPIPGALPLFASGLAAIGLIARRRKRKIAAKMAA